MRTVRITFLSFKFVETAQQNKHTESSAQNRYEFSLGIFNCMSVNCGCSTLLWCYERISGLLWSLAEHGNEALLGIMMLGFKTLNACCLPHLSVVLLVRPLCQKFMHSKKDFVFIIDYVCVCVLDVRMRLNLSPFRKRN